MKALTIKRDLSLQQMVNQETKNRAILTKFIAEHMKEGIDYGKIHINGKCENKWDCKNSYHYSKDCLFKPGSEKFVSLMKLRLRFKKDNETWEMAGSTPGLFCYVAELINLKGDVIGEGRGAASINEKSWSMNNAIKIAQKRAQIDAVLRTGGLSDFFTQDLEDIIQIPEEVQRQALPPVKSPTHVFTEKVEKPVITFITSTQKMDILELMSKKGKSQKDLDAVVTSRKKEFLKDLTTKEAEAIIEKLESLPDK